MDLGGQLQQALIDRAAGYFALTWMVAAIMVGLIASETKKRRFWTWLLLSLATGPVAWYLLLFKVGIAVPTDLAVECPNCHRQTRSDMKTCVYCKRLITPKENDRATQIGQTAATMVFTAKTLFGRARKVADQKRQDRLAGTETQER